MKPQLNPASSPTASNLSQLVSRLVTSTLPTAVRRKSFIVNDIPAELYVAANEDMLAAVLSNLLNTVINHTENSCVRVSAKVYGGIILVYIKDSGSFNSYTVAYDMQQLQLLAKKMGGCICVNTQRKEIPGIAFSFPNVSRAAA